MPSAAEHHDAAAHNVPHDLPAEPLARLLAIMARLRDPQQGCPWDIEQDFRSILPYTIEEAYEVADAIERADWDALRDELGDLLLQVVFHSRMAEEDGLFRFEDVAAAIGDKMLRRHPHVFAQGQAANGEAVSAEWERIKQAEREAKAPAETGDAGVLADIPAALPALLRAQKLQKRAARVGFDWPDRAPVIAKIHEELAEVQQAEGDDARAEEIGDLLFAAVNLARHLGVDAEDALRGANRKFERRFRYIETQLRAENRTPQESTPDTMDALWNEAKRQERGE